MGDLCSRCHRKVPWNGILIPFLVFLISVTVILGSKQHLNSQLQHFPTQLSIFFCKNSFTFAWNSQVWANNSVSVCTVKTGCNHCLHRPTFHTMERLCHRAGLRYVFCPTFVDKKREMSWPQCIWQPDCIISVASWLFCYAFFFCLRCNEPAESQREATLATTSTQSAAKLSWQGYVFRHEASIINQGPSAVQHHWNFL